MIQDLMKCDEEKITNTDTSINSNDIEFSKGYLYAKGLIKTKKQLVEGNVQIGTFLTEEGSRILGKSGLMKPLKN
ncbi:MAG: hypothetical protein ABI359_14460 [Ginsengibacter sp.]